MGLMDFFSSEAGQKRRNWLDAQLGGMWEYVPPELRPWMGVANEMNPVTSMERAGGSARAVADPNVKGWDKVAAVGDTASNMANAIAPVMLGSSGAVPAANAVEEALMGFSAASPMAYAARDFVTDEFGGVGFRAYHGSPHDFDRFSLDKIGTGEGAQAYGHGLYFAEDPNVARTYQSKVSAMHGADEVQIDGRDINWSDPMEVAAFELHRHGGDRDAAADFFERTFARGSKVPGILRSGVELPTVKPPGRMYEVQINADPNDFLDWDKPLSEQPRAEQAVGRYLEQALNQPGPINEDLFRRFESGAMTGQDAARMVGENTAPLREAGIPGIKYLDAGSRGAGDGSRNYVVFDDKLIEILRKYGLVPGMIGAGAYGMQPTEAQAGQ